jgi:hypothetical protein
MRSLHRDERGGQRRGHGARDVDAEAPAKEAKNFTGFPLAV